MSAVSLEIGIIIKNIIFLMVYRGLGRTLLQWNLRIMDKLGHMALCPLFRGCQRWAYPPGHLKPLPPIINFLALACDAPHLTLSLSFRVDLHL